MRPGSGERTQVVAQDVWDIPTTEGDVEGLDIAEGEEWSEERGERERNLGAGDGDEPEPEHLERVGEGGADQRDMVLEFRNGEDRAIELSGDSIPKGEWTGERRCGCRWYGESRSAR